MIQTVNVFQIFAVGCHVLNVVEMTRGVIAAVALLISIIHDGIAPPVIMVLYQIS